MLRKREKLPLTKKSLLMPVSMTIIWKESKLSSVTFKSKSTLLIKFVKTTKRIVPNYSVNWTLPVIICLSRKKRPIMQIWLLLS